VLAAPVVYSTLAADRAPGVVVGLGLAGVGLLLLGTAVGASDLAAAGIALGGAAYAFVLLVGEDGVDLRAPLIAAALVLAAELAYSALEPPVAPAPAGIRAVRALRMALTATAAAGMGVLVLFASVAELGSAALLQAVGVLAAVAALGVLALLARRLT
jgi:hypothetical protein